MACQIRRINVGEVLCITHHAVLPIDSPASLSAHSSNYGKLIMLAKCSLVYIGIDESARLLADPPSAVAGRTWRRLLVPLRQLMLEEKPAPLPFCPDPVRVVACSSCLDQGGGGWIGTADSFANHKRKNHRDALGISIRAQPVGKKVVPSIHT
jgi:hypothetical protein